MSDADKAIFDEVLKQAASKATDDIRTAEGELAAKFKELGNTVIEVDRKPFIEAAKPLHNDPDAGATWTKEQYDALQAL